MVKKRTIVVGDSEIEVPDISKNWMILGGIGILGIWFLFSAMYTIDADEVGVIQQFGRFTRTTEPGLHFKLPFGIETLERVKVQQVKKQEFGFRTVQAGVRTQYSSRDFQEESLMLTGDLNSALVEWIVQYRIKDPAMYLFNVRNPDETLRDVSESVMRQVVGDHSVDEVIVLSRQDIEVRAQELTQTLLNDFETGIDIVTIKLQDVNPPAPVQPAFNEVNEARQERERIINQAMEAYNKVIPQAKGQAEQMIRQAEGYATDRVNRSRGDAERFTQVWQEYTKAKDVTRRRLYLETMLDILPKMENIYVVDDQNQSLIPLLQLQGKAVQQ